MGFLTGIGVLSAVMALPACGSSSAEPERPIAVDAGPEGLEDAGADEDAGPPVADAGPREAPPESLGPSERPAAVRLPPDYSADEAYPLVLLLHGYTASGALQEAYFRLPGAQRRMPFVTVLPDGMVDARGNRFWNATDACCDLGRTGVDDSTYLGGLIDEAVERLAVDPDRVYLLGHSNGGFMSYRMACDHSEKIAAIASLAGATWGSEERCEPARPVSVLQIHGTVDSTIQYGGGGIASFGYPSARDSVSRFATRASCAGELSEGEPLDYDGDVDGSETRREALSEGCAEGTDFALWSIEEGGHIPSVTDVGVDATLAWLFRHRR